MIRETFKTVAGVSAARLSPQCRYSRAIFILAHMRCGSTALSNILCSRPDTSGYGEAHIRYEDQGSLGRLVVNQTLRRAWKPTAPYLFDKILHNRHDMSAPEAFFEARAIFVIRQPGAAIRSIRALYDGLNRAEYGTDTLAATYYVERVGQMADLWVRFPAQRRIALTHAALMADPEASLAQISTALKVHPALENRYESRTASRKGGGGDPTSSGHFTRIEARGTPPGPDPIEALDIKNSLRRTAQAAYDDFIALSGA